LMVGCAAGEGHLDGDQQSHGANAEILAASITRLAQVLNAPLIVLKEFPARYRGSLQCLVHHGFTRMPSMPSTRLNIDYANFDDYMNKALGKEMRRNLRRKFKATQEASAIEMTVVDDVTSIVGDIYPLYLQVYGRSKLQFEKLTEDYFCSLGRVMPEKARFFVWRQGKTIVAFMSCLIEGDEICAEYIGLEYPVALDLHLYFYSFRDVVSWAIANGFKWYRSSALNYDPKFHLKHSLDPLDLYVGHTSKFTNAILRRILPLLEPTGYDKTLPKFSNYADLWA
jgi:predicted N-acyltransferase